MHRFGAGVLADGGCAQRTGEGRGQILGELSAACGADA